MPSVLAATSAYHAGQVTGRILLLVLFAGVLALLLRRVIAARPRPGSAPLARTAATPPADASPTSLGPPGAAPVGAAATSAPAAPTADWPRRRVIEAIGAGVAGVLLIAAILSLAGVKPTNNNTWTSSQGREIRAGFIRGCQHGAPAGLDCECVFERLRSTAPYDKPRGFVKVSLTVIAAARSHDLAAVPPGFVTAIRSCVHVPS